MDATGIAALIGAGVAAMTALTTGAVATYKAIKEQAKAEFLREQSANTIKELETNNAELELENKRLWSLLSQLEKS